MIESSTVKIKPITVEAVNCIAKIELSAHQYPMSTDNISSCFSKLYHNLGLYIDDELCGFALIQQIVDEASIIDICIAQQYQGKGFGRCLLSNLIDEAKHRQAKVIFLEVRESNIPAIQLYSKMGFIRSGERKDYYPTETGRENAILMELKLQENTK